MIVTYSLPSPLPPPMLKVSGYCSWIWSLAVSLRLTDFVAVSLWWCQVCAVSLWLSLRLTDCVVVSLWWCVLWLSLRLIDYMAVSLWGCEPVSVTLCAMVVRLWGCDAVSVCYGCEPVRLWYCVRWQRCVSYAVGLWPVWRCGLRRSAADFVNSLVVTLCTSVQYLCGTEM